MKNTDLQIYTIGHGNRKIDTFLDLLLKNGIKTLADVRSIPYSRYHPQYRRENLKKSLNDAGINYHFLGDKLGGRPSESHFYVDGKVCYNFIRASLAFKAGIKELFELMTKGDKVTLMCSESDQNQCHRKHLISHEIIKNKIIVNHINKLGELEFDKTTSKYEPFTDLFNSVN